MLNFLLKGATVLQAVELKPGWVLPADTIWIDLLNPTRDEELAAERALGILLPTREEMSEIETSSRLYREDGAVFMTAQLITNSGGETPISAPVTFVLAGERLITIRYVEPTAFKIVADQITRDPQGQVNGAAVLLALID